MQLLKALWALAGAALCCFLVLVIHAQFLKEGNCPRSSVSPPHCSRRSLRVILLPAPSTTASLVGRGSAGPEWPVARAFGEPSTGSAAPRNIGAQGWHRLGASPG